MNTWNLLADLSATTDSDFDLDKDKTRTIYSKLFWGSNLLALTPPGKHYEPVWPGKESKIIRQVLREGLAILRNHIENVKGV